MIETFEVTIHRNLYFENALFIGNTVMFLQFVASGN